MAWKPLARVRRHEVQETKLEQLIPAEITDDVFSQVIEDVASTEGVHEILEIGSSGGDGSTAAWVRGRSETRCDRVCTASKCRSSATPRS